MKMKSMVCAVTAINKVCFIEHVVTSLGGEVGVERGEVACTHNPKMTI